MVNKSPIGQCFVHYTSSIVDRGLVTKVINAMGGEKINVYDQNGNLTSQRDETVM